MIREALAKVVERQDLSGEEMAAVMDAIMTGEATPAQIGAFITALRMKGETVEELGGAAGSMRRHATYIDAGARSVIDTCGTGGDGMNTFNISTTTAFVAAGAGISVAKHGNRAVSSKCGSADVLRALGVNIEVEPEVMEECIQEFGIGFLYAPRMHPAMKYAIGPRRELGLCTIFNMLGPLTNPAGATGQVLGVFAPELTEMFAGALRELNCRRAFVVHGSDGLDEMTVTGPTRVSELRDGIVKTYDVSAEMFFGDDADPDALTGGEPEQNAAITRSVLEGKPGPCLDIVLLNAAAAIVVGEQADTLTQGLTRAREAVENGAALNKLEKLVEHTNV